MIVGRTVSADELDAMWPRINVEIAAACAYNGERYCAENYYEDIKNHRKQLWVVDDNGAIIGVVVTEIINYPKKRCVSIDICTGHNLSIWGGMVALVEEWAKSEGCQQAFFVARPGMAKVLKDYRKTHVLFEKNLI